ncbi:hypothetical protein GIB67_006912 [Kingdonia uniflora]|uniref:DNA helicase n=1 Tax=Kingdonia uniflora TaxID=39325 RepID=A0A7J7L062_9MAGN|nr:hypothetical protein GIB67_006912 [Kingdonia uniflora]
MDLDPEDLFRDDDDADNEFYLERDYTKELIVYLVDASPKMFIPVTNSEDQKDETHFCIALNCISQSLKTLIINSSYDEVAICFFNTKQKKNLQDLNGVFVYNVVEREYLDRPTARLIKEFDSIEGNFMKEIGSAYGIISGSRENSLYNALWVAQALLRKGSAKTANKRVLLFTNEDDPFGNIKGVAKSDMVRTTLQRAKDAQELGISIELLPLYTGALFHESPKLFQTYKNENVKFTKEELSEVKKVSTGQLRLLGFKPLSCLKDFHNLRPSTFLFPSDEEILGCTCSFIALHRSMVRLGRFALAFFGISTHPQLVALIAQEEITTPSGQVEPPGMHMIYLPYSDDIRPIEEVQMDADNVVPNVTDEQIKKATAVLKRIDLKDFSVCQFANPALQRHYAILQALALDEDEMPEVKDETLPDEQGMARERIVNALEEFKVSVYGENYLEDEALSLSKNPDAAKKRKAAAENAGKESANYEWGELADTGKLKDLTVVELKYYLMAHNLPVTGKKEALISRILAHLGK